MSATLSLYEGILIVLAMLLTWWGIREARHIQITVNEIRESNAETRRKVDQIFEIYGPALENWKEAIDKNLEIPISEHLFHALFNTLVTLGASDLGKESQAKQNMAIHGFQKIGGAIGRGIKKEIPAIDTLSGMVKGKGGGAQGGGLGIESIVGEMFGIDLPAGSLDMLMNMGGGGQVLPNGTPMPQPKKLPGKNDDNFWKG